MGMLGWLILAVGALGAAIAVRSVVRDARLKGAGRGRSTVRAVVGGVVFLVVLALTAVVVTRLVGGPGAPDGCAGDECDANLVYVFALIFVGLPVGIAAAWTATRMLRRVWR